MEIDWAENIVIHTKEDGKLKINILVTKFSYSRYMKLFVSYEKSSQTVLKFLVSALAEFQGSPLYLVCDNMKSIISKNQNYLNKKPILEKH
ncbi:Transposase and inactivated derivatives [Chlamydia trachomatis]|nr:Transposase and inactivated derivatives [Chlamydia trachomatis]